MRLRSRNARAIGASILTSCHGTIPVSMAATEMYNTVQTTSETRMPIGKSRCGRLASCAVVETASNPMYAKKIYAAPAPMPEKPMGAKACQSCPQFDGLTYRMPRMMTNNTTETLMATMVALKRALSLMPITRTVVMMQAIINAGTLT